jgi:hypothetical protein
MFANQNQNQNLNMQPQQLNTQQQIQQLQNVVQQLSNDLTQATRELERLRQTTNNPLEYVSNGLERMGKFDVKPGDENIRDKKRAFLDYRNTIRRIHGLTTSNYVVCRICKEVNAHYTNYCPKQLCDICLEYGHNRRNCKLKFTCQVCDSTNHPTSSCKEEQANAIRAKQNRICMLCGAKGHIAKDCGTKGSGITKRYFTPRRNIFRGRRGNFRSRGKRGGFRGFSRGRNRK